MVTDRAIGPNVRELKLLTQSLMRSNSSEQHAFFGIAARCELSTIPRVSGDAAWQVAPGIAARDHACPSTCRRSWAATHGRTITDRVRIAQIAAFAQAHADGWGSPWYGTPVGDITLEVYEGPRFMGHLAIGSNFLESQGCNDFMSRRVSPTDRRAILSLVGVSEDPAK